MRTRAAAAAVACVALASASASAPAAGRRAVPGVAGGGVRVATPAGCECNAYCRGQCAPYSNRKLPPPGPAGPPPPVANLTLYRFTPRRIAARLANTNTGDVGGDLGFFVARFALGERCAAEPTNLRCFLSPWADVVYARWRVELDTGYGPYLACNPAYGNPNGTTWDLSRYMCSQSCVVPPFCPHNLSNGTTGGDGQVTCFCARSNRTVGVDSFGTPLPYGDRTPPARGAALRSLLAPVGVRGAAPRPAERRGARGGGVAVPTVCEYGTTMLAPGQCLGGCNVTAVFTGSSLDDVLARCCSACVAPACSGWTATTDAGAALHRCSVFAGPVTPPGPVAQVDGGRGFANSGGRSSGGGRSSRSRRNGSPSRSSDAVVDVGGGAAGCVASARRDPLVGGSWNWGTMATSGGNWLSTPSDGECVVPGSRPGDGSECTWRALGPPDVIETVCLREKLAAALTSADPACRSRCRPGDGPWSDCVYRECYWLALNGGNASAAKALWRTVVRPAFDAAWSKPPPAGCLGAAG